MDTTRTVELVEATRDEIPLVEDLARFYLYDMARQIGPQEDWVANATWRCERMDLSYAWNEGNHPFLIEVDGHVAGFCLIDRYRLVPGVDWNMSEFYVSAPWAGRGVGRRAAEAAFDRFMGWQLAGGAVPSKQGCRALLAAGDRELFGRSLHRTSHSGSGWRQCSAQRHDLCRIGHEAPIVKNRFNSRSTSPSALMMQE